MAVMEVRNEIATRAESGISGRGTWSTVACMALCVALLIASEFMPVSLLSPIAKDLHATEGMTGQAISVSGLFAVVTSFLIASIAGRFDRRHVLTLLAMLMLISLMLIAMAPNFAVLMVARAVLGMVIGGFWSLSTATVMRLVVAEQVPKALGVIYMGNAIATAFAAPIGSYFGGIIGWRGVFWAMTPIALANVVWVWISLPPMRPEAPNPVSKLFGLLKRRNIAFAMLGVMFTFAGGFSAFTYLRPFLETYTRVNVTQLSLLLLGFGTAGFVGTYAASALVNKHLYPLLSGLAAAWALVLVSIIAVRHQMWPVAVLLVVWGALNAAIPVCWSTWLSRGVRDEPESGGGLMVGAIQLSIMLGGALGGSLLDHFTPAVTFAGGAVLLSIGSLAVGNGARLSLVIDRGDRAEKEEGRRTWTSNELTRKHL